MTRCRTIRLPARVPLAHSLRLFSFCVCCAPCVPSPPQPIECRLILKSPENVCPQGVGAGNRVPPHSTYCTHRSVSRVILWVCWLQFGNSVSTVFKVAMRSRTMPGFQTLPPLEQWTSERWPPSIAITQASTSSCPKSGQHAYTKVGIQKNAANQIIRDTHFAPATCTDARIFDILQTSKSAWSVAYFSG